jgi:hypothetical protein
MDVAPSLVGAPFRRGALQRNFFYRMAAHRAIAAIEADYAAGNSHLLRALCRCSLQAGAGAEVGRADQMPR